MTDPYAMGPPRDYTPPDPAELASPEHHRTVRDRGREKVLASLAEAGIERTERGWDASRCQIRTEEKNR